jgi:error-prone DNA polymerase
MGWSNPPIPWSEFEQRLSGTFIPEPDGGDAPGWSRKRTPFASDVHVTAATRSPDHVPYAELHAHSAYSFLDGAAEPEELAEEAARLGLDALALTDHDGFYGVVRFAEAAREVGVRTVFGAELSLGLTMPQNGVADPEGRHLLVIARDPEGYRRLSRTIAAAQVAGGAKGKPVYDLDALHDGTAGGHWLILTGCRKGAVRHALATDGIDAARRALDDLVDRFGRDHVVVELTDHGDPADSHRNDALAALAKQARLEVVATTNAHYHAPERAKLAAALAAVRARRSLDELDGWLPASASAHLRSGAEMAARFARYPGAVDLAAALGRSCAFDLALVAPQLPDFDVPDGHTPMTWLRELTWRGAADRYGSQDHDVRAKADAQLEHELAVIDQLNFPGYFLIVWDIVEFCRANGILCQGRGSAANSAVCFVIGITNVDPILHQLLFERFLSTARDGPPDIDIDIESGRREEVIQYVYQRYGRDNAAQVANVISYRPKSAVRDMAKALGYSQGQQDAWSKRIDRWSSIPSVEEADGIPADVLDLAAQVLRFPRHLGIHSGGMVLCDRPVADVVPVEWARMPNRSVLQWDKDDCASAGLVKFDLLGLGMLEALHGCFDLIKGFDGTELGLHTIPPEDPAVYDMLCAADAIGVFQVESRAQLATLPRLKPRTFYDLVTEVAIIRPGPIQGGSVHPFIRRKTGQEPVTYPHPLLEKSLKRTYGVPLFQEQVMQMAIDVAGLTPAESDQLRQAMGSKRSPERMEKLRQRLFDGMAERGVVGDTAEEIFTKLQAFSHFGFPESHSVSFAHLVYVSAWLKCHHPAAFCASLLNAQPMGFYSPQSLIADARRHGVEVRGPCVASSDVHASLERDPHGAPVVRMGLSSVRTIGDDPAQRLVTARTAMPFRDVEDLAQRVALTTAQWEALATADALACFQLERREALWAAGALSRVNHETLEGTALGVHAPTLPGMTPVERTIADLWATGVSLDGYPTRLMRAQLDALGVVTSAGLRTHEADRRILVAGIVTHRQRPATAGGITFLNLEDETGMINIICSRGLWLKYRTVARTSAGLIVRGRLERHEGVVNIVADHLHPLPVQFDHRSRDFC